MKNPFYELIIIGAGAAGLSASIYASRYKIDHLVFGETPGGQGNLASLVENYPGFTSISGPDLMQKFLEHAKSYGVEILPLQIDKLSLSDGLFQVQAESKIYQAKTIILALGAHFRTLGIPGEKEFLGKGVSYCTTCDAPLYRGKTIAVVGGGDAALTGAIHAASFASKVYLIHRRDNYRSEPIRIDKMKQIKNIEEILSNEIVEILATTETLNESEALNLRKEGTEEKLTAQDRVGGIVLAKPYKGETLLPVDGVFIEIGHIPSSALVGQLGVEMDENSYVKVTPNMETNVPGVFAAGDLALINSACPMRQFITAASDGARASGAAYRYLQGEQSIRGSEIQRSGQTRVSEY